MAWEEKPMSLFVSVILRRAWVFAFILIFLLVARFQDHPSPVLVAGEPVGPVRIAQAKLPLCFEPNLGQADPRVKFLSRGRGYTLFLTKDEALVALPSAEGRSQKSEDRSQESEARSQDNGQPRESGRLDLHSPSPWPPAPSHGPSAYPTLPTAFRSPPVLNPQPLSFLCLKMLRANPAAKVTGLDELPGKINYFIGNDPGKWRTNLPTYARVRYENVYSGIDLAYYGKKGGELEYDFIVAPGADPGEIALAIDAVGQVSRNQKAAGSGRPSVVTRFRPARSVIAEHVPGTIDIPQSKIQNRKSKISSSLHIAANGDLIVTIGGREVRFHKPVVYQVQSTVDSRQSTVKSIPAKEERSQASVESSQFCLRTDSTERGTDQRTPNTAKPKIQSPELRQWTMGHGHLLAVDSTFNIQNSKPTSANLKSTIQNRKLIDGRYVLKSKGEVSFEIASYDRTLPLIIDPVLSYSTYLGGSDMDYGNGIAVDASGNAYVTGYTASLDFPLVNPAQGSPGGGTCSEDGAATACFDAFVTKLNPRGLPWFIPLTSEAVMRIMEQVLRSMRAATPLWPATRIPRIFRYRRRSRPRMPEGGTFLLQN